MQKIRILGLVTSLCVVAPSLISCGGGNTSDASASSGRAPTQAYVVAGNVTGLSAGSSVTLTNNGADALAVSASGGFAFAGPLASGSTYAVAVATPPQGKTCTVSNGAGTVSATNVTAVTVACSADPQKTYVVRGTVSGLGAGTSLQLLNNNSDRVVVSANGAFAFPRGLVAEAAYETSVRTHPVGQTCTVANGSGTLVGSDVTAVAVTCAPFSKRTYSLAGTVSGLSSGGSVTLLDGNANALKLSTNGAFVFPMKVASGSNYAVTVGTQPSGASCAVSNGTGTVGKANVSSIDVACSSAPTYSIGGTVSGLANGESVTLLDNKSSSVTIPANGTFVFATQLPSGASYAATVGTQPSGATCAVTNGTGTVAAASVASIAIACQPDPTYSIGGTVTGLATGQSVGLLDNTASALAVTANGAFSFATQLASGATYSATVATQPSGQTCTVADGTGTVGAANVSSIAITCGANPSNPAPTTRSLAPTSATTGGSGFTLTVDGTNFISSSVVYWNGVALPTTYTSATQLTASVPAADLASVGTASITVVNPAPGGGTSGAVSLSIGAAGTSTAAVRQVQTLTGGQTHANGGLNAPWSVSITVLQGSALWVVGTVPIIDSIDGIANYTYPNIFVSDGTNTYTNIARVNDPNLLSDAIEGTQGLISWTALNVPAGTYTVSMMPGIGGNDNYDDWVAVAVVEITGVSQFDAAAGNLQLQVPSGTNAVSVSATTPNPNGFLIAACFDDESSTTNAGAPAAGGGFTDQGAYWPLVTGGGMSLRIETLALPAAGTQTAYFSPTEGADSQKRYPDYLTLTAIFH